MLHWLCWVTRWVSRTWRYPLEVLLKTFPQARHMYPPVSSLTRPSSSPLSSSLPTITKIELFFLFLYRIHDGFCILWLWLQYTFANKCIIILNIVLRHKQRMCRMNLELLWHSSSVWPKHHGLTYNVHLELSHFCKFSDIFYILLFELVDDFLEHAYFQCWVY